MHNSYDVPSSYNWNSIEVKQGYYVPITYTHEVYEQIETHSGKCNNYHMITNYNSRSDCIRKCKLRESVAKCGVVYEGIDIYKDEGNFSFAGSDAQRKCVIDSIKYGDHCTNECPWTDCRQDWFTPKIIFSSNDYEDYTLVQLIPPTNPKIIYRENAKVFSNLSLYLASGNLSLWFGLALYILYNLCCKSSSIKKM